MFSRITVAGRLALGFSFVVLLLIAIATIALVRLAAINSSLQDIVRDKWVKVQLLQDGLAGVNAIGIGARDMAMAPSREAQRQPKERLLEGREGIGKAWEKLQPMLVLPKGRELMQAVLASRTAYIDNQNQLIRLVEDGKGDEARQYIATDFAKTAGQYRGNVNALIAFQGELMDEAGKAASEQYESSRALLLTIAIAAVLGAAAIALWITRSVTVPLGGEPDDAKAVVERIAHGDLTTDISTRPGDDASLIASMQRMQTGLRGMIGTVKESAEAVAAAAGQLAGASNQVAAATAAQSDAAAGMAAAVEQMTVSINHVSNSTQEAHTVTARTGELSDEGNRVIQDTATEMSAISQTVTDAAEKIRAMGDSTQRISGIVQVIKDVADQTNLLALNAAIEAARAGEQGRGFAVVADEVRKLAERTAQATGEIGSMIQAVQADAQAATDTMRQTVDRVAGGVAMARRAGESMAGISQGARQVVTAVNDINEALKEQSLAANDIAGNVESIAQMSEENSAASREAADTASRLQELASVTHSAVATFKV